MEIFLLKYVTSLYSDPYYFVYGFSWHIIVAGEVFSQVFKSISEVKSKLLTYFIIYFEDYKITRLGWLRNVYRVWGLRLLTN